MSNIIPRSGANAEPPATGILSRFTKPEMRSMTRAQNAEIAAAQWSRPVSIPLAW